MTGVETDAAWIADDAWHRAAHDARYGHCAHCGISLIEQFGTDGPIIVSMGWCNTCGVVTSWGIVVAD